MTNNGESLYSAIQELSSSVGRLRPHAQAAIFGACARGLAPLLKGVERRTGRSGAIPDFDQAVDMIDSFATGVSGKSDHGDLRARLSAAIPHGDDLGAPWSTYAQDAIICADAGLVAASIEATLKPIWIQYALEPQMASMQIRDMDLIRSRGDDYWASAVMNDPTMMAAVAFLRESIAELEHGDSVGQAAYQRMIADASVLRPADS